LWIPQFIRFNWPQAAGISTTPAHCTRGIMQMGIHYGNPLQMSIAGTSGAVAAVKR